MKITKEKLINPPKKYRPAPFWSWNDKLETTETCRQIAEMEKAGMGGYFMHARGGLKTEYMSDEWMDNIRSGVLEGEKLGMEAYGYDENGWPSGFGSEKVNSLGLKYQQKTLKMSIVDEELTDEFTISNEKYDDGKYLHFYYEVNPFYVDLTDSEVTDEFIKVTHEKYKEALGDDFKLMKGFFTDEPQLANRGIPWSFIFPEEYKKEYNEDLIPLLKHLFITSEDCYKTRYRYSRLKVKLFYNNYTKRVYDWCEENNMILTGHMYNEPTYAEQVDPDGSVMPHYMYMHIPGIDALGRKVERKLHVPQLTSVCAQTGKKQILTESFGLCGWDVTFEELKWILEWQMVKGVNYLCQHLSGYSLKGIRKRDYPASHFCQNPWWNDYKAFNDFASRMGMLLAEGEIKCEVLVLHTISSAWLVRCDDYDWKKEITESFNKDIVDVLTCLDKNQILYHLGDEAVMEKLASVEDKKLKVGEMTYKTVIVPSSLNLSSFNYELLKEFKENGGNLIFVGEIPSYIDGVKTDKAVKLANVNADLNSLISKIDDSVKYISLKHLDSSECDVQYIQREFEDFTMYYFVNTFSGEEAAELTLKGKSLEKFNYLTGETEKYPFECDGENVKCRIKLKEKGSVVFFVYNHEKQKPFNVTEKTKNLLNDKLKGEWSIKEKELNALTLDLCDVYFDGEKKFEKFPVIDVQEIANKLKRKVNIRLEFTVKSEIDLGKDTFLVVEEPQYYEIFINGERIQKKECGFFRDKSFIKLDIQNLIKKGENKITLITDFVQSDKVYKLLEDVYEFEVMKNKLYYDRELENIYIMGNFCTDNEFGLAEDESLISNGEFVITSPKDKVNDGDLVTQGFSFYTGKMTLVKKINLTKNELNGKLLSFERMGAVITKLKVNGKELLPLIWAPYEFDLDGLLTEGENTFEFELTSNFRNLLGPFHQKGDCLNVTPGSFYKETKIFLWGKTNWYPDYNFIKYGIFFK
ncbi:MAG: hypothetical protein J6A69_05010 [Clostridia bacterium]|nr:hypothetical protein [Clostridia bacterium]